MYDSDYSERAAYYRRINRTNRSNPTRFDCPDCGAKGALSAWEKQQGYHCKACTRSLEGPAYEQNETSYGDY